MCKRFIFAASSYEGGLVPSLALFEGEEEMMRRAAHNLALSLSQSLKQYAR